MEKINYYHFFGVNKESSTEDICNAVIKLKDNFDEKYGMLGEVATDAILSAIWDGFTILTDPEKKAEYDSTFDFKKSTEDIHELYCCYPAESIFSGKDDCTCDEDDFGPFGYIKQMKRTIKKEN